jgi:type I restriction enzyme S subunit
MSDMKELPEGWEIASVALLCNIFQGYGFPKNIQGSSLGQYPFFKVGDISRNVKSGNKYLVNCENYIDQVTLEKLKAKLCPINTIVFAKIGEGLKLNRRAIMKQPGLVDNNVIGLKAVDRYFSDLFLFYFLNIIKLEDYSRATTVPSVRKSDIEDISIPLPPLPEQHRIVARIEELFSSLDKGVEILKTAQAQLKTYRQAILKWAFEGKLTNAQTNFQEMLFGEITELITSGSRGWADYYSDKGSIFIRAQNIKHDTLNLAEIAYVKLPNKAEGLRTRVHKGDLLITITGANVTKTALVSNTIAEAYVSQHVALCRLGSKELIPKYFYWFIVSDTWGRRFLSQKAYGAGKPGLNLQNIQDLPVRYPSYEEQSLIVSEIEKRLSVCDKLEESIAQSLQQAEALRQSILKKAFEGRLVPQDPDDEPASVLLQRIRAERAASVAKKATVGAKNATTDSGASGVRAGRRGRRKVDE